MIPFFLPLSNFISQLIYCKSRNLLKLFKYFNGTTTSVSYVSLSSGILHIFFVLYSKDLLVIVLSLFFLINCRIVFNTRIIYCISVIIIEQFSLYSNRLYVGITISQSSGLSINVLLIFNIHDQSGALLLKSSFSFLVLPLLSSSIVICPFTTVKSSRKPHKSDVNIEVLNLIFLLAEYLPLDESFASIHVLSQISMKVNGLIA